MIPHWLCFVPAFVEVAVWGEAHGLVGAKASFPCLTDRLKCCHFPERTSGAGTGLLFFPVPTPSVLWRRLCPLAACSRVWGRGCWPGLPCHRLCPHRWHSEAIAASPAQGSADAAVRREEYREEIGGPSGISLVFQWTCRLSVSGDRRWLRDPHREVAVARVIFMRFPALRV